MDLTHDAMLVSLRISAWSGRLYDRKASNHVAVHHEASASAGRYNKCLLPKAAFAAIPATMSKARSSHYEQTLPWDDQGSRLLTVANYEHYMELLDGLRERMVRERARFIEDYEDNIDQARLDLGKLFHIEDYPSKEALQGRFGIRYRITPVPDADHFMAKLASDDTDRVKRDIEHQIEERLHDAVGDLYRRLGEPRPAFDDWKRARDAGIDMAPPPAVLRPWRPGVADVDDWREPPKLAAAGRDALVMACDPEPPEAQALWRAADCNGIASRLFEADRRLDGYDWHDELDRVTGIETEIAAEVAAAVAAEAAWLPLDDFPLPERAGAPAAPLPGRPQAIRMTLAVTPARGSGRTLDLPADLAFAGEAWSWVAEALPLVTADSDLQPHQLAELLRAGFFSPSDDADSDSWETQRDRFDQEASHIAMRLLASDDEARIASIAEAVRRELFWLVPRDRPVEISICRPEVRVTLRDAAEDAL